MKKTYEAPSVEKIAFMYRDQVVVASGGTVCTQEWQGFGDFATGGCSHKVAVKDSGF